MRKERLKFTYSIAKIRIPDNIIYFAVDEKHRYIYGLKGNEELYRYKFEI